MMASALQKYAIPVTEKNFEQVLSMSKEIRTYMPMLDGLDSSLHEVELYIFGDEEHPSGVAGLYRFDPHNRTVCINSGIIDQTDKKRCHGALLWMVYHAFYELGMERVYIEIPHVDEEFSVIELWAHLGFVIEGTLRGHILYHGERCDVVYLGAMKADYLYILEDEFMLTQHWQVL